MNRKQFLQQVTSFIRSKPAQQYVEKELNQHIHHAKKAWVDKGYQEMEAEALAVQHMGNPMTLGKELSKVHKPKVDWVIIVLVALLFACSFLPLVGSDSMLWRHVLHIGIAIIIIICFMLLDVQRFLKTRFIFYAIIALFALLLYSTHTINGERIFFIGSLGVTVWHTLLLFCIAWAVLFSNRAIKLWRALFFVGIGFLVIAVTGSMVTLLVFSMMSFVMLLKGHFERKQKMGIIIGAIALITISILAIVSNHVFQPYQLDRLQGFFHPVEHADGSGYVYLRINEVVENAKWFGAIETDFFIEHSTDFVFLQLIKYYGYFVGIAVAILLLGLIARMCKHSMHQPASFAKLLIVGASTLFATQALYALAMGVGLTPIIGVPLPFITYGLTPTVMNACLIGLVLSVYRRKSYIFSN
ncbi:FtsW/RodA/SpoVE family cell cycle protein [Metasolibacillus meyeri]|uniref:FtsW/RodA/SpoVE family cell cycle protein n=1 Tax=Metasolibacillus meyeri TaxID=1071052 RepID=A0AAW9NQ92_9BACL|nr:FtsW/RodA/SpoVE family cell cycle protein [Metasolibacillus meyeri]MEC1177459.1 FtsW/RodA/SpoVE family cell cycle protein [Metasolibacillus meyeri]